MPPPPPARRDPRSPGARPGPDDGEAGLREARHEVESGIEGLGDTEASPTLPSSTLAAGAVPGPLSGSRGARARSQAVEILHLAWPVMLSQVLVSLSGLVDRAMIGRLGGPEGAAIPLAAAGFATQLFWLVQSTLFAIGLACVALMARAIGAGDPVRARQAFAASIQVALGVSGFLMLALIGGARPILSFLGAEPTVIEAALPYLRWVIGSSLALAVALVVENALRADRNTRIPMLVALAVTALKLLGNWVLIYGHWGAPRLGLEGAGMATALSQLLGLVLFVRIAGKGPADSPRRLAWADVVAHTPLRRDVLRIAAPGIAERLVMNAAMLAYFWVLGHGYGILAVAAYSVGVPLLSFSWIPGQGYAQACATLVGQSLGALRPRDAVRTGWVSSGLALATAVLLGVLCHAAAEPMARAFTDDDAVVRELVPFLQVLALAQPLLQLHFTLGGAHRGAGDTWTPLVAATVGNWLFRVPIAALAGFWLGLPVVWVWWAILLDHLARAAWLAWSFQRGRWRHTRIGAHPS